MAPRRGGTPERIAFAQHQTPAGTWLDPSGSRVGSGSVVIWLAERVCPTGRVLANDIDTRFLQDLRLS